MSSVRTCAIHNTFYKRNEKTCSSRIVELYKHFGIFKNTREVREALASRFLFAIQPSGEKAQIILACTRLQRLQHIDAKLKFSVNPKPKN